MCSTVSLSVPNGAPFNISGARCFSGGSCLIQLPRQTDKDNDYDYDRRETIVFHEYLSKIDRDPILNRSQCTSWHRKSPRSKSHYETLCSTNCYNYRKPNKKYADSDPFLVTLVFSNTFSGNTKVDPPISAE